MASNYGACTVLMDLDEFEDRFLPAFSTLRKRSQDLATGFVSDLSTLLARKSESRQDRRENIGNIILAAINGRNLAQGHRARGYHYASESRSPEDDTNVALLYPKEHTPAAHTEKEDWSRVQMIIQFESGGARYDPFDDDGNRVATDSSKPSEQACTSALNQFIWCATSTFRYQHRVCLLALYLNDRHLRAIRLDHSGIVISRPVDYLKNPSLLPRLLWRFAHLTDAQKGLDTTATRLDEGSEDYRLMDALGKTNEELDIDYAEGDTLPPFTSRRRAASHTNSSNSAPHPANPTASQGEASSPTGDPRVFKYVRRAFRRSLGPDWPRYRLKVGDEGREFLIATPATVSASELFGRGCRAYVAVDCATHQFVWLKDSWRPASERSRPEGAVLAAFAGDSKLHVPTLVCHGYVRQEHATESGFSMLPPMQQQNAPAAMEMGTRARGEPPVIGHKRSRDDDSEVQGLHESPKKRTRRETPSPPAYGHYRLVVKEVALDLKHFVSGWQLVRLILECVRTHGRAYKEYGLLHGDISPGNILIHPTISRKDGREVVVWHGMLIDWELAHGVRDSKPRGDHGPILSWEYASIERINNPRITGTVEDELEAFFYVLLWYAVRYLRHTLPRPSVTPFVTEFFDTFKRYPNGRITCGDLKHDTVMNARLQHRDGTEILFCDDGRAPAHPLNGLLLELLKRFQVRYAVMHWDRRAQTYGDPGAVAAQNPLKPTIATAAGRPVLRETQNLTSRGRLAQATGSLQAPSAKARELARGLQSHKAVVALFSEWVLKGWPLRDRVGDKLSTSYVYTRRFVDVPTVAIGCGEIQGPAGDVQRKRSKLVENGDPMAR